MSFDEALNRVGNMSTLPEEVPCLSVDKNKFSYDNKGDSIVSEVRNRFFCSSIS